MKAVGYRRRFTPRTANADMRAALESKSTHESQLLFSKWRVSGTTSRAHRGACGGVARRIERLRCCTSTDSERAVMLAPSPPQWAMFSSAGV